jgi:hypothetical protein
VQWAVLTVIGGPLAFPVAYGIDDFFFPGSRNHFERLAGLEQGGYAHVGTGPVQVPLNSLRSAPWPRSLSWPCLSHGIGVLRRDLAAALIHRGTGTDRRMTGGLMRDE